MVQIKICGITNIEDAKMVSQFPISAIGMIFSKSPRKIDIKTAKHISSLIPKNISRVGVFVNESPDYVNDCIDECSLNYAQLHGDEDPQYCKKIKGDLIKVIRVRTEKDLDVISSYPEITILLDTYSSGAYGGTGKSFDWSIAKKAKRFNLPLILSGGLSPANIAQAIIQVEPSAIDVNSGIEKSPGHKDAEKIQRLIEIVSSSCIISVRGQTSLGVFK